MFKGKFPLFCFCFVFITACGEKKKSFPPLLVKNSLSLTHKVQYSSENSTVRGGGGTAFVVHFDPDGHYSSQESLNAEREQDLFLVTSFHVVCCGDLFPPSGSSFSENSLFVLLDGEVYNIEDSTSAIQVKEPYAFSFVNDLAVFRLRREDFPSDKYEAFLVNSGTFQQGREAPRESSPFQIVGFSGAENRRGEILRRRTLVSEMISRFGEPNERYFFFPSFGHYLEVHPGLSGSPVLSSQDGHLRGVVHSTRSPGFLIGNDTVYLQNLLRKTPFDCSSLDLERGAECIWASLIQHLNHVYEQAEAGEAKSQYRLVETMRDLVSGGSEEQNNRNIQNIKKAICENRDSSCLEEDDLERYIRQAAANQSRRALYISNSSGSSNIIVHLAQRNHLPSIINIKEYCLSDSREGEAYDDLHCLRESKWNWKWLKDLAELGHIEAQCYYGIFLSCENRSPFSDCDNEESSRWLQEVREHEHYEELLRQSAPQFLKENCPSFSSSVVQSSFSQSRDKGRIETSFFPVSRFLSKSLFESFFPSL